MPRIYDNRTYKLSYALNEMLPLSYRADFCVGYFNLRGWREIDQHIECWPGGEGHCARVLVGMPTGPQEELFRALSLTRNGGPPRIDNATAIRLKQEVVRSFREQLMRGAPRDEDEDGLQRLSRQLKAGKVVVKLHTRYPLHAKLYLLHRHDPANPIIGFVGSSNLTLAGLSQQGELNVDVLDRDSCEKLQQWFEDHWNDQFAIDISRDLAEIIDESWAREELIPPYYIYLKMIYHLSEDALEGMSDFRIPPPFDRELFDYQAAAVKIAARHLTRRGGVMIGDVVGLGKTMMATALAKVNELDTGHSTLIICPKNLERMWDDHRLRYGLSAEVLPISMVERRLDDIPARFRLVLIDESHNLRNREGKRYRVIQEYIRQSGARCILLTATPYNKSYVDLGSQLRLFVDETADLGIRPENYLREIGEDGFMAKHQAPVTSLAAFEHSKHADDWRELMRMFLVRRTRSFIMDNYAQTDPDNGRKYLVYPDGTRSYFPTRVPKTLKFRIDEKNPADTYARMFSQQVVDEINQLHLPRYGLANYLQGERAVRPTAAEGDVIDGLTRAGRRLMGFTRTNLFKRLESSGPAFIQSLDRHILRNFVYIHALENDLPLPIGTQGSELLDPAFDDEDPDLVETPRLFDEERDDQELGTQPSSAVATTGGEAEHRERAAAVYQLYATRYKRRFKWLRAALLTPDLRQHLLEDSRRLLDVLADCGAWRAGDDEKLAQLIRLLTAEHPDEKVIVFSQFADTVRYLVEQLRAAGITAVEGVTGDSPDPTAIAERFSPRSNQKKIRPEDELRVLVSTDVLSEGQNLQDCAIVVNYDLPWAIIRLIQRAGRVDRIGQQAEEIRCYSFLPADGIEEIIRLRERITTRLRENAEVVGADEAFFDDGQAAQRLIDLYHEKAGVLDDEDDADDTDLASRALTIWQSAVAANPRIENEIKKLPDVVYSTRALSPDDATPEGVIVYMKTQHGTDALALVGWDGEIITQSQSRILDLAACRLTDAALERHPRHHDAVTAGVRHMIEEESRAGGQLGAPSGARFRTYTRLKDYALEVKGTLFDAPELRPAIDDIYRYPLRSSARDTLNRLLRSGVSNQQLAETVIRLRSEDRLSIIHDQQDAAEPRIICSLGLRRPGEES